MSSASSPSAYKKSAEQQSGDEPKVRLAYYPWYVKDWLFSETRNTFTLAERGLYRDLLDWCWYYGTLPKSRKVLRQLVSAPIFSDPENLESDAKATRKRQESDKKATRSEQRQEQRIWQKVLRKFDLKEDGRYHHPKVDENRNRLIGRMVRYRESASKGGFAKARKERAARASDDHSDDRQFLAVAMPYVKIKEKYEVERAAASISTRARSAAAAAKNTERKPPARASAADLLPYAAELVDEWRLMLNWHGRACRLPPVDDRMLGELMDLCCGAPAPDVHKLLKQLLHERGRLGSVRSWGLFPLLLRPYFEQKAAAATS